MSCEIQKLEMCGYEKALIITLCTPLSQREPSPQFDRSNCLFLFNLDREKIYPQVFHFITHLKNQIIAYLRSCSGVVFVPIRVLKSFI